MEYVYAALLLHDAKKEISEANVLAVIKAAGAEADAAKAKALVSSLKGVDIEEAVKKAAIAPVAAAPAAAPHAEGKKEEKKEEKKSEEEAAAGLASLFG
ncbi:MAG: 50S ribosomal protein P1 [Candidatus Burarchaeum sp.]|nr:50S ribosomal protein P1 [Candidatus Burarchaeum sp.]MDO8340089.1 50S ribosomal protein P1 [Candidatus Burarchaeum sp.]